MVKTQTQKQKKRLNKSVKRRRNSSKEHMINKFIKNMMSLQMTLKMVHWTTKNYAVHKATDKGIQKILPLIDTFVETFLGKNHFPLKQNAINSIQIKKINNQSDLDNFIKNNVHYLINLNTFISKEEHSDLVSVRDDIVGELNVLKYLLNFTK